MPPEGQEPRQLQLFVNRTWAEGAVNKRRLYSRQQRDTPTLQSDPEAPQGVRDRLLRKLGLTSPACSSAHTPEPPIKTHREAEGGLPRGSETGLSIFLPPRGKRPLVVSTSARKRGLLGVRSQRHKPGCWAAEGDAQGRCGAAGVGGTGGRGGRRQAARLGLAEQSSVEASA